MARTIASRTTFKLTLIVFKNFYSAFDCRTSMAKITYIDPIKSVSGKLTKKHCVVYNVRQAATNNPDMLTNPNYTAYRDPNKKIRLTAGQRAWQQQFGEIIKATRIRMEDPQHMTTDRAEYAQQTKYKTLWAFVFNKIKNEE